MTVNMVFLNDEIFDGSTEPLHFYDATRKSLQTSQSSCVENIFVGMCDS